MKLSTLKKSAAKSADYRGHRLKWQSEKLIWQRGEQATGFCKCGAYVQCLTEPMPNQISIGGDAVAINCPL